MQMIGRSKARPAEKSSLLTFGLFFLSFLIGLYAGRLFAASRVSVVIPELNRYFKTYSEAAQQSTLTARLVLQSFFLYFRYPLLVFLLGFASFGVLLLLPLTALLSFSFSYSVSCFVAAMGTKGLTLALALLGLRYFVTLPCFFVLGQGSLRTSWELTCCTLGQGKRRTAVLFDRTYFWRFLISAAVLAAGAVLDLWLTPWLLSLAGI